MFDDPIKITVEDHKAVKVEGGGKYLNEFKANLSKPLPAELAEVMWGTRANAGPDLPPAIEVPLYGLSRLHNRCDMLHFVFGGGGPTGTTAPPWYRDGRREPGGQWVLMHLGDVYVDGEKLIDNGYLTVLKDPEIQSLAKELNAPKDWDKKKPLPAGYI
jgi:hypothetical protein